MPTPVVIDSAASSARWDATWPSVQVGSGLNRMLVLIILGDDTNPGQNTVRLDPAGLSIEFLRAVDFTRDWSGRNARFVQLYYLPEALLPAAGLYEIRVSYSQVTNVQFLGVYSLENVDQVAPTLAEFISPNATGATTVSIATPPANYFAFDAATDYSGGFSGTPAEQTGGGTAYFNAYDFLTTYANDLPTFSANFSNSTTALTHALAYVPYTASLSVDQPIDTESDSQIQFDLDMGGVPHTHDQAGTPMPGTASAQIRVENALAESATIGVELRPRLGTDVVPVGVLPDTGPTSLLQSDMLPADWVLVENDQIQHDTTSARGHAVTVNADGTFSIGGGTGTDSFGYWVWSAARGRTARIAAQVLESGDVVAAQTARRGTARQAARGPVLQTALQVVNQ